MDSTVEAYDSSVVECFDERSQRQVHQMVSASANASHFSTVSTDFLEKAEAIPVWPQLPVHDFFLFLTAAIFFVWAQQLSITNQL